MNVNATGSMEQMQLRKMDGTGGGHGKGGSGMREIMQSLPQEDQDALKAKMGEMSMEDRMAMVSQLKEVDKASMSDQEYVQSLLEILDTQSTEEAETDGFSVYA